MSTVLEQHGTATSWRRGCRCPRCRSALRRQAKIWWATRVLRRGGDPATHVPVRRVRRRIELLEAAGWSRQAIARAAGVAPSTITRICSSSTKFCSRIVAAAILDLDGRPAGP